jgi:protein-S-isoprenylcysteine O-methyltransferase
MLRKVVTALLASAAICLIPATLRRGALDYPQLWILVAVAMAVSIFQPAYKPIGSTPPNDRGTALQIVWSVYLTQFLGILEALYFRYPDSLRWTTITTLSLVAMLAGLSLRVWAVFTLGRYFTWYITVQADQEVIRSGPFRFLRHPSYCGAWILFVASLLFIHAWFGAALSLVVQLLAYRRRIRWEEAMMIDKLGESYKSYARDVKALIPLLW